MEVVARVMLSLRFTCGRTDLLTVWVLLSLTWREPPLPSAPQCPFQTSIHTFTALLIFAWHSFTTPIKILFRYYKNDGALPQFHQAGQKSWQELSSLTSTSIALESLLLFTVGGIQGLVQVSYHCALRLVHRSHSYSETGSPSFVQTGFDLALWTKQLELWSSHLRPPGSRTAGLCLQTQPLLWF